METQTTTETNTKTTSLADSTHPTSADPSPTSERSAAPEPRETTHALRRGGCHCGAVRFEVTVDVSQPGSRCNCSVCTKTSVTSMNLEPSAFTLLAGEDALTSYVWGYQISRRFFCRHCGVHCFGRGFLEELGGNYVSVNLNCLDDLDPTTLAIVYWDGRHDNWHAGPRSTPWPMAAAPAGPPAAPEV